MFKLLLRVKKNLPRYFAHKQSNITVLHNLQLMKKAFAVLFAVVMLAMAILPGITTVNAANPDPITGVVINESNAYINGVEVTFEVDRAGGTTEEVVVTTDSTGTFTLNSLLEGDVAKRVKFHKVDVNNFYYVSQTTRLVRETVDDWWYTIGEDSHLGFIVMDIIAVTETVDITGIVVANDLTLLEGVTINVYPDTDDTAVVSDETGADGLFTISPLPALVKDENNRWDFVRYLVEFEYDEYIVAGAVGLEEINDNLFGVSLAKSLDVNVFMGTEEEVKGTISGTVLGGSGEVGKLDKVTIALYREGSEVQEKETVTDENGFFKFTGLDTSTKYTIKFFRDPYILYSVSAGKIVDGTWEIELEEDVNVLIVMNPTTGELIVNVVNQDDNPLGGVSIDITKDGKTVARGQTEGNGTFKTTLDKGIYSVTVSRTNYDTQTADIVVIDPKDPQTLDFTLTMYMKTYLFGLDLPHSLMVGGLGLGIVIILVMFGYRMRVGKSDS